MSLKSLGGVLVLLVVAGGSAPMRAQAKPPNRLERLERWIAAVGAHRPGVRDEAVEEFAALPGADREPFTQIAWRFAGFLHDPVRVGRRTIPRESGNERVRMQELAAALLKTTTDTAWLHRAAVFHADVMMLAADLTQQADLEAPERGRPTPGLVNASDGEVHSTGDRNWSLAFGRRLIADVAAPERDDFAGAWFHATSVFLLENRWLGELRPHLVEGEQLRPTDQWILFDQGTLFEAFGGNAVQAVVQGAKLPAGIHPDVPGAAAANEQAAGYFRRIVSAGPSFIEARVRYGRLLIESGRYDDAMLQFDAALSTANDRETLYFAHLFALRAEQGRGHIDAAFEHGRAAAQLFPTAQSAAIALSQLALRTGDLAAAIAPVETIRAMRTDGLRDDPWWRYYLGAGRASQAIIDAAWSTVK